MKVTELSRVQLDALKERMVFDENEENGEPTTWGDLAASHGEIPDERVFAKYADTDFSDGDFFA